MTDKNGTTYGIEQLSLKCITVEILSGNMGILEITNKCGYVTVRAQIYCILQEKLYEKHVQCAMM